MMGILRDKIETMKGQDFAFKKSWQDLSQPILLMGANGPLFQLAQSRCFSLPHITEDAAALLGRHDPACPLILGPAKDLPFSGHFTDQQQAILQCHGAGNTAGSCRLQELLRQ